MATCVVTDNVEKCVLFKNDDILILDKIISNREKGLNSLKWSTFNDIGLQTVNGQKKEKSESKQIDIISAAFSTNSNFFVACDTNNCLYLWKNDDNIWKIISTRHSPRKCQKVIFSNLKSDIILADRGGDVFRFSSSEVTKEGDFILGHISFITDISISPDDKYLASCDRDGKIRISNYPNCYSIHSYCLGHTMFISSVYFLNYGVLSGSGDGTLRLWGTNEGDEKECEYMCKSIKLDNRENLISDDFKSVESSLTDTLSKESLQFAVLTIKSHVKKNVFAILFYFLKGIAIYKVTNGKLQFSQFLHLASKVKDVIFLESGDLVVTLRTNPLKFCEYKLNSDNCYMQCQEVDASVFTLEVQEFFKDFNSTLSSPIDESMLFKKNFDNDDEIENKSKRNKT